MIDTSPYTAISDTDALAQWRRILERTPQPRQEAFLPIEVLLAYGLFWVVDPHRFGGANIASVPPEVHQLAKLLCRSPGSLTSKMLNLDGSRLNAGRLEVPVYQRLSVEPGLFPELYRRVLLAGRLAGLDDLRLPDFLGMLDGKGDLLGQDELGDAEIDTLLEESGEELAALKQVFPFTERDTERVVEHRARLGQHRFARQVLHNYDHQCAFCGFAPRHLPRQRLLVASHIKPWRVSTHRERLDPRNGVAACPVHDSAFDVGLLTVNGGLRIHRSDGLQASLAADNGVPYYFAGQGLRERLIVPGQGAPDRRYLAYHHEHVFQGRGA